MRYARGELFRYGKRDAKLSQNYIRTFAIITAENPRVSVKGDDGNWTLKSIEMSPYENNRRNEELGELLKRGRYVFRKIEGQYGGLEHPFMILNITLSAAKHLAAAYDQESFIFARRLRPNAADGERGSNMEYTYYAVRVRGNHAPAKTKVLERFDTDGFVVDSLVVGKRNGEMYGATDTRSSLEYDSGAEDFYSRKGDFKFTIPFTNFSVSEAVELYKQRERALGKERFEKLLTESLDDNYIGKTAWYRRIELLEGT